MKVLIVDDSIVFRTAIKKALLDSGDVSDVSVAANGKIACEKLRLGQYDGVTLDLEMPVMDGVQTIKEIRTFNKEIPIIIFTAQSLKAADKTLMALKCGATDFVQKIQGSEDLNKNLEMIRAELIPRFIALTSNNKVSYSQKERPKQAPITKIKSKKINSTEILCIASSTGGPDVLMNIFSKLNKLKVPVLIVQHMPPVFTARLALSLDKLGPNKVVEAKIGDVLEPGVVYIAPGDFHMRLQQTTIGRYVIALDQGEKVCYVRPSADVLFESVAGFYNENVTGIVLTGMGNDGAVGSSTIKKLNGMVFVQDEESCVVWGMPKAVVDSKSYDDILNLDDIIKTINTIAT